MNDLSFDEHRVGAEAIIERERSAGWMDWRATAAELEAAHGAVTYSRIGVIAKVKDGAQKLRLIHDLRRSGVNRQVRKPERLVLARLTDLREDILEMSAKAGADNWEAVVLVFADAFKHLKVHGKE